MHSAMKSKVFQVRPSSPSLRGTVPWGIAVALKLQHGDTLKWVLQAKEGKIIAVVEKAEGSEN